MEQGSAGSQLASNQNGRCARPWHGYLDDLSVGYPTCTGVADRIRTGCVHDVQPASTFGLLVTRDDPRTRRRGRTVLTPIHEHWPLFAPSVYLLTGHGTACRSRHCRGVGRCQEHTPLTLGWPAFAAAYRAELEKSPLAHRLTVLRQILAWLSKYPSVTVLSFESGMPKGEALIEWELRGERVPWAQRHVFRDWLVSLLPLAVSLGVRQVSMLAGARVGHLLEGGSVSPDQ